MLHTKNLILMLLLLIASQRINAQLSLPYTNNFDLVSDTTGWSHYALNGSDDWEVGTPSGPSLHDVLTAPNVWGTNLNGNFTASSVMCLESPGFDFSDTSKTYKLSFGYKMKANGAFGLNIQYSLNNGATWLVLDGGVNEKSNWYNNASNVYLNNEPSWTLNNNLTNFKIPIHSLDTLKGETNVRFRFKFGGGFNPSEGCIIDNFSIVENYTNLYAVQSNPFIANQYCNSYDVDLNLIYNSILTPFISVKLNYYWSNDNIFDPSDTIIGNKVNGMANGSNYSWDKTFPMPANIQNGTYYIFYYVDADSAVAEHNELDNLGMAELVIEPILNIPFVQNFDNGSNLLTTGGNNDWKLAPGSKVHLSGVHSGNLAWSIFDTDPYDKNYIQTPLLDMSIEDSTVISLWYKSQSYLGGTYNSTIQAWTDCKSTRTDVADITIMRDNKWDFLNAYFPEVVDTSRDAIIRIYNGNGYSNYNGKDIVIDDIYIGKAKPDLSIERDLQNRYTSNSSSIDNLTYYLNNSGLRPALSSQTLFYWSTDTILDAGDILLGTKIEQALSDTQRVWSSFSYTKPTTTIGTYYIFYELDNTGVIDEMREYNNMAYFTLHQQNLVTLPYYNDFETQSVGWRHNASFGEDDWELTTPNGAILDSAYSGTNAWVTNSTSLVSPNSRMHLYTPVFDLSTLSNPVLDFDMKLHSHPLCHCFEGKMNMSYSIDNGATWTILDTSSQSYNKWYNAMEYEEYGGYDKYSFQNYTEILFEESEPSFVAFQQYNSRDADRFWKYILDISFLSGQSNVQFRFNLGTLQNDLTSPNYTVEGALIDNFSIQERTIDLSVTYEKSLSLSSLASEVKFFMNVKNIGNYASSPSSVKYYLSADGALSASDYYLGEINIPEVKPDLSRYINAVFESTPSLTGYTHLIYVIDDDDFNAESNELNNIGAWPLLLDNVSTFPYLENFEDTVIDGWNHFVMDYNNLHLPNFYRVRNIVAPSEPLYQTAIKSGELFTDRIDGAISNNWIPTFYIESPAYNFSYPDSIYVSFDFYSTGGNYDFGGNMAYSIDGGNNWILLTNQGASSNWYNIGASSSNLINEPCWGTTPGFQLADFDLSFLQGEESVVFRYKYKSNHHFYGAGTGQGFRLDNFFIDAYRTNNFYDTLSVAICPGDTFVQNGIDYFNQGNYEIITGTGNGFDSIQVVALNFSNTYNDTYNFQYCQGESHVMPNGTSIYSDTSYINYYATVEGCDSTVSINVTYGNNISGNIKTSTNVNLTNSKVYLIDFQSSTGILSKIDSTTTNSLGEYSFVNTSNEYVYLKAIPNITFFPNEIPNYFTNSPVFQYSDSVLCSFGVNFNSIAGVNTGGNGFVGGYIGNGAGKNNEFGLPIENLAIFLMNANGEVVDYAITDENGFFFFNNIACGDYTIWVDDGTTNNNLSPTFSISGPDCIEDSLMLTLNNNVLKLTDPTTGIRDQSHLIDFNISPNPSSTHFIVRVDLDASYSIEIYDLLGKKVFTAKLTEKRSSVFTSNWANGIYNVILRNKSNQVVGSKKVVVNR